jgi:tripartite-type tricarboxylate transporter receptor subunit TctC
MESRKRKWLVSLVLVAGVFMAVLCFVVTAFAAGYPTRPVKIITPFTQGGATDIFARILSKKLSELWGQQVVVENCPGEGGMLGAVAVAKSAPDGYTLLVHSAAHATNSVLYSKLPYDPQKDLIEIAPIATQPFVLVVGSSAGIKSVSDLIAMAKSKPGQIKFSSAGTGSGTHLCAERFRLTAGIDVVHVPNKGGAEANADTMAGKVTYWFPPVAMALKEVRGGRLLALGVASAKRSSVLPEVPTMAEAGVNLEVSYWFGTWAPAGISASVKDKLAKDIGSVLSSPDVRMQLIKLGAEPMSMTPEEFKRFVRNEIEATGRALKAAGIEPQ